ncbi:glycosyltransferase [Cochleicola gelatinilyticus]|uniref:Glycosyl transferase family 1 n=1 Tax=Cochleicola gelatinilyticus TaxID=1763537 RepID=A0A167J151_9FLAO|nr:glycosyltransferase [Cochleicola gelatinilyticus]OAB80219.1 hypothetical protein ULVI_05650 [Cochleicola gelatinilyticus]
MKKTRVAHIADAVGGVAVYLQITLQAIDPEKIEAFIIQGHHTKNKIFKEKHGNLVQTFLVPIQRAISPIKDLRSIYETAQILRKEKPDVIHAHSAKGGIVARAASLFYPTTVLYTPHAFSYLSTPNRFKKGLYLRIERLFKHFNSILLACSTSERNRGIREVGYKEEKALVFNNCIHPISETAFLKHDLQLPEKYLCTVGRPSYQKNIEMMIEVLNLLKQKQPNIHLVIMGVGEYSPNKEHVEQLIETYGLSENTTLIPWIERGKIFTIVSKSQLYLSTARYEGLPYAVIEAMALGKACVVTSCDGNKDLIKDGYNGYVVEENSVETMANRTFALLQNNALLTKFENNALDYFNEHHNINNTIQKLEGIYRSYSKNKV